MNGNITEVTPEKLSMSPYFSMVWVICPHVPKALAEHCVISSIYKGFAILMMIPFVGAYVTRSLDYWDITATSQWVPWRLKSPASRLFRLRGILRWPLDSPHKWPVTRQMVPFITSSWNTHVERLKLVLTSVTEHGFWLCWQPIGSEAWTFLLTNMDFNTGLSQQFRPHTSTFTMSLPFLTPVFYGALKVH